MNHLDQLLACGYSYHRQPFGHASSQISYYLFRLQTEGSCRALVNGEMTTLAPGDLLLYRPGEPYELQIGPEPHGKGQVASGDFYLYCRGSWIDRWWEESPKSGRCRIHPDENLISLWRHLNLEHRRTEERNEELVAYLLRSLCLTISRLVKESDTPQGRSYTALRMKNYIAEHAVTPLKVEDVARHVDLSVSRAVHLFKDIFGTTMIRYAQEVRLASALERIRYSDMSLEQIAEASGFPSYTYFHRVFRDKYRMSPSEYRRNAAASASAPITKE
ncbi:AraC family transcriptional regulator [Gorillibacterium sp. sgz5001074]|uniref:helix-turn-helix transcriptional regulator n=1 Tax=Gorillibacterium sp. sgz5001074 TaxID=3446695 RepID=UPI003F671D6D